MIHLGKQSVTSLPIITIFSSDIRISFNPCFQSYCGLVSGDQVISKRWPLTLKPSKCSIQQSPVLQKTGDHTVMSLVLGELGAYKGGSKGREAGERESVDKTFIQILWEWPGAPGQQNGCR